MNQSRKGYIQILLLIGIAAAFALGVVAYKKADDAQKKQDEQPKLGAQVLDTQHTDTLGTFRTNVNTSIDNLNTEVEVNSGTIHSYGNIVNENIPLRQSAGGLGSVTLPTDGQFLSANNSSATWKTFVFSAGLNSTNTATSVQIGTAGFDNTANIQFKGTNTHSSGTETFAATSTFASNTVISYLTYGIVVASGSTPLSTIIPSTTGNILSASGSVWASKPPAQAISGLIGAPTASCSTTVTTDGFLIGKINYGGGGGGTTPADLGVSCTSGGQNALQEARSISGPDSLSCTIPVQKNTHYAVATTTATSVSVLCVFYPIGN